MLVADLPMYRSSTADHSMAPHVHPIATIWDDTSLFICFKIILTAEGTAGTWNATELIVAMNKCIRALYKENFLAVCIQEHKLLHRKRAEQKYQIINAAPNV